MFGKGRECSLCGGRLNSKRICTECGLDNTKCDKDYRINQNVCDDQPLTHVHQEEVPRRRPQANIVSQRQRPDYSGVRSKKQKSFGPLKIFITVIAFIVLVGAVLTSIVGVIVNIASDSADISSDGGFTDVADLFDSSDDYEFDYDPYEYVERELSETGEVYDITLGQGEYLVGVHLPEGAYTISSTGEYVSVDVNDDENGIWLYENLDSETPEVGDIRLYTGARVQVNGDAEVSFSTQNAQLDSMTSLANPLTEEVLLPRERAEAGVDFTPGVYDVYVEAGYGSLDIIIYDDQGEEWETLYLWLDADSSMENIFRNVVLPQGAVINYEDADELRVSLKPSEVIASEDYTSYYMPW